MQEGAGQAAVLLACFGAGRGSSFFCTRPLASSTAGSSSYLPLLFPSLEAAASRGVEQPRGGGGGGSGLEGQEEEERLRQPQAGQDQAGGAAGSQGAWPEAPGESQLPARGNCPPSPHIPRCSHCALPPHHPGFFLGQPHWCHVSPWMSDCRRILPPSSDLPCPLPSRFLYLPCVGGVTGEIDQVPRILHTSHSWVSSSKLLTFPSGPISRLLPGQDRLCLLVSFPSLLCNSAVDSCVLCWLVVAKER